MAKTGLLLINIGSPRSYEEKDVAIYLKNFLMDKEVINLPFILRWPLVNLLIVPRRAAFSAGNYKKVWMEGGSPIAVYSHAFAKDLQATLGDKFMVKVGLRYSEPTVESALQEMVDAKVDKIIVAPMFPQYAEATTGSSLQLVDRWLKSHNVSIPTVKIQDFYDNKSFIDTSVALAKESLAGKSVDHYLFSFHGLPKSHIQKAHGSKENDKACFVENMCVTNCYRSQCFKTAEQIAQGLGLASNQWSVAFQSRLGRAEWLTPSTDHSLEVLAKSGKHNVAVLCPSFVADCIETLEEIGMGGQEVFHEHGGKDYYLTPCVNADPRWVAGFAELIQQK